MIAISKTDQERMITVAPSTLRRVSTAARGRDAGRIAEATSIVWSSQRALTVENSCVASSEAVAGGPFYFF